MIASIAFIWDFCLREGIRSVSEAICKGAMLSVIKEETDAYLEFNRKTPLHHMEVLRQISVRGKVHKPYSAEFLQACRVSQSQMQKILTALGEDERINRDSSGVYIVDPLERLALRVIGTREEWRSQLIESHLESA